MYSRSFRTYALAQGLNVSEQARLFAKFAFASGDAFITCWESKAHWSNWRPQTAIRLGDSDPNPKTKGDSNWTPAVATPPYPDVASGYNCGPDRSWRSRSSTSGRDARPSRSRTRMGSDAAVPALP